MRSVFISYCAVSSAIGAAAMLFITSNASAQVPADREHAISGQRIGWGSGHAIAYDGVTDPSADGEIMESGAGCGWTEGYSSSIPGLGGPVYASVVFDDGSGDALYVGGEFTVAGGVVANYIAKWDGTSWSALGTGMNSDVYALTVFDDGGGPALYAGGGFTTAGGVSANGIARWDGASWSDLGTGMGGVSVPSVRALAMFDDGDEAALYAGGFFTTAGGTSANRIAKWDGTSWSAVGTGMNDNVFALTVFDDGGGPALYAGGWFTTAGGVSANKIARWDGTSWSALGPGMNFVVFSLTVFDDGGGPELYAGGEFTTAGGVSANRIAKWDGASWSPLGTGIGPNFAAVSVDALTVFDNGGGPALYVGGDFTTAGGVSANGIARWDGASWSALGTGMGGPPYVYTLTVFDDGGGPALYAGGFFTTAGGVNVGRIARWDGTNWSALGTGMNGWVRALTVFDDGGGPALYAGGNFTTAGGVSANHVARWDGMNWSALDTGLNDRVYALTVFDDGSGPAFYAAGPFTTAGDFVSAYIARWACPTCNPPHCNGHGECQGTTCICDAGFEGPSCDACAPDYYDYPNCVFCDAATTCSGNGTCNALGGCDCDKGYSNDGLTCVDDDECALGTHNCDANATCSNTPGSFDCTCNAGYEGDGIVCTLIDPCLADPPLVCDDGQFCNGIETCTVLGCTPGQSPCNETQTCNEDTDTCEDGAIPTVSEWGLLVLTLLLLAGAKVCFRRRKTATAS